MAIALGGMREIALVVRTHSGQSLPVSYGMDVVGCDGVAIGRLKDVRSDDMLVDRPLRRDVYVPFETIDRVTERAIVLTIPANQVETTHWTHPPLL